MLNSFLYVSVTGVEELFVFCLAPNLKNFNLCISCVYYMHDVCANSEHCLDMFIHDCTYMESSLNVCAYIRIQYYLPK